MVVFPSVVDYKLDMPHRKTIKHYEANRCVHELTFSCYQRMPLLTNDHWRRLLAESISVATRQENYLLLGFVFMPEHVHLLVLPTSSDCRIANLLKSIKRPYSSRIKQLLQESGSPLLERLTVRQRPGVITFRYWQEGPGYDRNLESSEAIRAAIDYFHLNPVKRKLCQNATDWKWSSARHFLNVMPEVDPDLPRIDAFPPGFLD
jgi:putative transposase